MKVLFHQRQDVCVTAGSTPTSEKVESQYDSGYQTGREKQLCLPAVCVQTNLVVNNFMRIRFPKQLYSVAMLHFSLTLSTIFCTLNFVL